MITTIKPRAKSKLKGTRGTKSPATKPRRRSVRELNAEIAANYEKFLDGAGQNTRRLTGKSSI